MIDDYSFDYKKILLTIPESPGCYIMKDREKNIVYIGKAKNLKKRVKNYFGKSSDNREFVKFLTKILSDIEVIITNTETEALKLEATLIRIHKPKFNIIYKDDKKELLIKLDENKTFPYLELTRGHENNKKIFTIGPFFQSAKVRNLVSTLNRLFKLRTCSDTVLQTTKRACLEYEIHRCSAPCINEISREDYNSEIKKLKKFLSGKGKVLIKELEKEMYEASDKLLFEKAAKLRDQIKTLKYYLNVHLAEVDYKKDIDIIGYFVLNDSLAITVLIIRNSLMIDKKAEIFKKVKFPDLEIIESLILQYYSQRNSFPNEVLLPEKNFNFSLFGQYFKETKKQEMRFFFPNREEHKLKELLVMANKNAQIELEKYYNLENKNAELLQKIKKTFNLKNLPDRIECFDNSNLQGTSPVASKVEFRNALPYKKGYRHFKIKTVDGIDDYSSMKEIIRRRIKRGIKENELPDLIVVDGGKGQLNCAYEVLKEMNMENKIDLLSIAKIKSSDKSKDQYYERIFKVGISDPVILKQNSPEIVLFVKLRNEAHRFAIEFHRKLRKQKSLNSVLDKIDSVGPKRKKILLKHFKSLKNIKNASLKELKAVKGISERTAQKIYEYFLNNGD